MKKSEEELKDLIIRLENPSESDVKEFYSLDEDDFEIVVNFMLMFGMSMDPMR